MHIICLTPLEPGVYNDHSAEHITMPPEGWAYIPDDMVLPSTFPRLGLLEAEELTYIREVEAEREVIKTRPVESLDEDGNTVIVTEEYTETETVMETHEYTMLTVTAMTEGTLPEPIPEVEPAKTTEERLTDVETDVGELNEALELILSGVTE